MDLWWQKAGCTYSVLVKVRQISHWQLKCFFVFICADIIPEQRKRRAWTSPEWHQEYCKSSNPVLYYQLYLPALTEYSDQPPALCWWWISLGQCPPALTDSCDLSHQPALNDSSSQNHEHAASTIYSEQYNVGSFFLSTFCYIIHLDTSSHVIHTLFLMCLLHYKGLINNETFAPYIQMPASFTTQVVKVTKTSKSQFWYFSVKNWLFMKYCQGINVIE